MVESGFLVHPVSNDHKEAHRRLTNKFPFLSWLPPAAAYGLMTRVPIRALKMGTSSGIISPTGATARMTFWGVPYSPEQMIARQPVKSVITAARYCERCGARIIGLGAYTSIIGEHGQMVADAIEAGITTGNSLTAATGVEGLIEAAKRMGYVPKDCTVAVIGAGGSVGAVSAQLMAEMVGFVCLVGRTPNDPALAELQEIIGTDKSQPLALEEALKRSNLVITVTSATSELEIDPQVFVPGAVICDIARPRDIAHGVAAARPDVLVIEGAILKVPGINVGLGFDFGFPPATTYACMAETLVLALEGRTGDYSLGKSLQLWRVKEIAELARKHGFTLAGFRSFERELPPERFDQVRERADENRRRLSRGR